MQDAGLEIGVRSFDSNGVEIAFLDKGHGDPILLVHGFASNATLSWVESGWVASLLGDGRRVVAADNRGHGDSAKFYEPSAYGIPATASDLLRLLDHLRIERADVMGYSMGARIAAMLAVQQPGRFRSLILGGMGRSLVTGVPPALAIAAALEAEDPDAINDEASRLFRKFADRAGGDRRALASCMRCPRDAVAAELLAQFDPVLLAIGTEDTIAGPIEDIAKVLPKAECFSIEGRDHMRAIRDETLRDTVLEFLARRR